MLGARVAGERLKRLRLSPVSRAGNLRFRNPGAHAPGFMLVPASQAKSLTASQAKSLTASQAKSSTTSQAKSSTASQAKSLTTSQAKKIQHAAEPVRTTNSLPRSFPNRSKGSEQFRSLCFEPRIAGLDI
jgi:hypothetical protein